MMSLKEIVDIAVQEYGLFKDDAEEQIKTYLLESDKTVDQVDLDDMYSMLEVLFDGVNESREDHEFDLLTK